MEKRVYVAGVYSKTEAGKEAGVLEVLQNIGKGQFMAAKLFALGYAPFCPWHDRSYPMDLFDTKFQVKDFYEHSLAWLEVSDAMLVISGEGLGSGVDMEIDFCKEHRIPVFYEFKDLEKWNNIGIS